MSLNRLKRYSEMTKNLKNREESLRKREESVKKREDHIDKILNVEIEQRFRDTGLLVTIIQKIEYQLRYYLYWCQDKFEGNKEMFANKNVHEYKVGEIMPDNAFSNYMTLNQLIDAYNKIVKEEDKIDKSIVDIRDNSAHGRFMDENTPLRLIKTDKNRIVTINEVIDENFMEENLKIVKNEYKKISSVIIKQNQERQSKINKDKLKINNI
jgi:hypothetical protein